MTFIEKNNNKEITMQSSAAKNFTYVASIGKEIQNIEVRYEDRKVSNEITETEYEKYWIIQYKLFINICLNWKCILNEIK